MYLNLLLGFATSLFFITSCSNSNKKSNNDADLEVKVEQQMQNKFQSMFSAPSPEEMLLLFEDSNLDFKTDALHDADKVDEYISSSDLAINLGVYVTDAAYLNLFMQYSGMTSYLESVFKIIDKLDMGGVYLEFDFKKVFREMDNLDSLIVISEGLYHSVTNYMTENNNEAQLCLISYGSIVELLYLTLESIPEFDETDPVLQSIYDQHMQLANLIEFANQYSDVPEIIEMNKQLGNIKNALSEVEHVDSETTVKETAEGKLHIGGGKKQKFTEEKFIKLKTVVSEARQKVTK